jgi:hypothetical protein
LLLSPLTESKESMRRWTSKRDNIICKSERESELRLKRVLLWYLDFPRSLLAVSNDYKIYCLRHATSLALRRHSPSDELEYKIRSCAISLNPNQSACQR